MELTLPADAPLAGTQIGAMDWPADTALVAMLRGGRVLVPQPGGPAGGAATSCSSSPPQDVEERARGPVRRRLSNE